MSCNHSKAITAFQQAKDVRALHKLLTKIMDKFPQAVSDSWDDVDLHGHPCPTCKKTGLVYRTDGTYVCRMCQTMIGKKVTE